MDMIIYLLSPPSLANAAKRQYLKGAAAVCCLNVAVDGNMRMNGK
jgi:hypothetical protein